MQKFTKELLELLERFVNIWNLGSKITEYDWIKVTIEYPDFDGISQTRFKFYKIRKKNDKETF